MRHLHLRSVLLLAVLAFALAASGTTASAANGWVLLNPTSAPSARASPAMAFDAQADRTILFGGITELLGNYGETWAYDAHLDTWTNLNTPYPPAGQYAASMVYDSLADRVLLFGGSPYSGGWLNDTWEYAYSLNTWTPMGPSVSPPGRNTFGMVYDSRADRTILFGGWTGANGGMMLSDTWEFDFNRDAWTNVTPASGPSARSGPVMAYDSASDRVLMYGGVGAFGDLHDTWAFDVSASTWQLLSPASTPYAVRSSVMIYNSQADRTILFGGHCLGGWDAGNATTWAFNAHNDSWSVLPTPVSPPCLNQAGMIYDSVSDEAILFGGSCVYASCGFASNATWAYRYPGWGLQPSTRSGAGVDWLPVLVPVALAAGTVVAGVAAAAWVSRRQRSRP